MEDPHKNKTAICKSGRDVVGSQDARDVRLQLYISLTLGVGAFLLFCVRRSSLSVGNNALTEPCSIYDHDGRAYTLHARSRATWRLRFPIFRIPSSAG
jgi:hypothetical protein